MAIGNWDNSNCMWAVLPKCLQFGSNPATFNSGTFPIYHGPGSPAQLTGQMYDGITYDATNGILDNTFRNPTPEDGTIPNPCIWSNIPGQLTINNSSRITIHCWLKSTNNQIDTFASPFGFHGGTAAGPELFYYIGTNGFGGTIRDFTGPYTQTPTSNSFKYVPEGSSIYDEQLHLLTYVKEGQTYRSYFDGILLTESALLDPTNYDGSSAFDRVIFGAREYFYGQHTWFHHIYGIIMYNDDIGEERILEDYNLGPDLGGLYGYTHETNQLQLVTPVSILPAQAVYSFPIESFPLSGSSIELYTSPYYNIHSGGIKNWDEMDVMPNEWMRKCGGKDYDNERELFRSLITEAYNRHGVCAVYFKTTYDVNYDRIWGEDGDRRWERKFDIMTFFPLQSEERMWTKFGTEGIDEFSVYVSKDHFREASTYGHELVAGNIGEGTYSSIAPKPGDVIQTEYNKYLYEIISVKEEEMMFHLSKHYVWEFTVAPLRNEHLRFNAETSASIIDSSPISAFDEPDIFDISNDVSQAVSAFNYNPPSDEPDPRDPYGGW